MINPLTNGQKELIEFVQDRAMELPVSQRIKIYRGMADFINDSGLARKFIQRAMILEAAEAKCRKLHLRFSKETGR
jgi:hypothetical protein